MDMEKHNSATSGSKQVQLLSEATHNRNHMTWKTQVQPRKHKCDWVTTKKYKCNLEHTSATRGTWKTQVRLENASATGNKTSDKNDTNVIISAEFANTESVVLCSVLLSVGWRSGLRLGKWCGIGQLCVV